MFSKRTILMAVLVFGAAVCVCISSLADRSIIYEVNPSVDYPLTGEQAAAESYERVIHHLIKDQSDKTTRKLDGFSERLNSIDQRLNRIEKALGIETSTDTNSPAPSLSSSEKTK